MLKPMLEAGASVEVLAEYRCVWSKYYTYSAGLLTLPDWRHCASVEVLSEVPVRPQPAADCSPSAWHSQRLTGHFQRQVLPVFCCFRISVPGGGIHLIGDTPMRPALLTTCL